MSNRLIASCRALGSPVALSLLLVSVLALGAAFVGRSSGSAGKKEQSRSASMHLKTAHLKTAHLEALNLHDAEGKDRAVTADLIPSYPEFVAVDGTSGVSEVVLCQQLELPPAADSGSFGWSNGTKSSAAQSTVAGPTGCATCQGSCTCGADEAKWMLGVDRTTRQRIHAEPQWSDQQLVPWESYAYGEYIGPFRTPHVSEYRLRIRDQIDFTYTLTREHLSQPYQIYAGDTLQLFSGADPTLNQKDIVVLSDGTISLPLVGRVRASGKTVEKLGEELDELYSQFVKMPAIIVQVTKGDTPANDLINAVIARVGLGGQQFQVEIAPDGTVALPLLGQVPAIGLTLRELGREVNTRYAASIRGLNVTPVLRNRAPRSVFVLGEVVRPGRIQIDGPTTVMQAIAMAEGWKRGSNLRQIVVFRRDQDWRLMATRIDLQGAMLGKSPYPSDEIWLRDSDIVLVPKTPILRASEAVDLYMTRTLYSIFPQQGVVFTFDNFQTF
jgi:polysaccharide biosynthesis/export protein